MDTTATCIRHSQIPHILPSASDSSGYAQSREDSASMGLEYWKTSEAREEPASVSFGLLTRVL